ncbi:hypothetical protein AXG93_4010s1280 [Marchantia polymorpha subsp. ruderalis]|uniref:Reverse transcriptase/retrotransposon-derived protein RNase H-like domain-containing protein n=1 Tax=Marchantia polymorpha subsp. ruderalis TaxID=1480154 RepID=A0A176VHE5_MARPO|nr:hypothetical protein AXG93_4010s1280 [Marchantia polymorpha subsp. ruderalis]
MNEGEQQKEFKALKAKQTSAPVLQSPDCDKPYHVYIDTLAFAIGVVLSQKDKNKNYLIYFASTQLLAAEKNYTTTKREAFGMCSNGLDAKQRVVFIHKAGPYQIQQGVFFRKVLDDRLCQCLELTEVARVVTASIPKKLADIMPPRIH